MSGHTAIPGYPGYAVDLNGDIWSYSSWRGCSARPLKTFLDDDGYPRVRLMHGGERVKRAVHVLVAETLIGPRPSPAHEVRHLNGCRIDYHPSNLAWGTRKENADDRERHGRTSRGAKHSEAIRTGISNALTRSQRTQIANLAALGKTQREIAALVQCSQSAVGAEIRRRS